MSGLRRLGRLRRLVALSAMASVVTALAVGVLPLASAQAAGATTITLYNAQHEQTTNALITAFTKATGIKVRVVNDDEDVLTAQIEQEGGRSPADVFYTENSNWLQQLDNKGLLASVAPSTLAAVPAQDSATNGKWVGISARFSVLAYNTKDLSASQLPTSVMDLARPQWKNKIELAPAETDFWPIVSSVDRAKGDAATIKWLEGLKANAGANANVPDNETLLSDISNGVTELGVINHYYFYRLEAEQGTANVHAAIAEFAPRDPGYVEDISAAGVLKSSKNQAAAQKFVRFLTSATGQRVLAASESFEYPLRPGVAASPELPPMSSFQPNSFTPADLGTGLNAKRLLQQVGLL